MSVRDAWRARAGIATVVVMAWTMAGASAASAHTTLIGADPAPDTTVTELTHVTLTFSDPVLEIGMAVTLVAGDGAEIELEPTVDDSTSITAAVGDLDAGVYDVRWRVVAEDGHPIEGVYVFTFEPPAPEPEPTPSITVPVDPPLIDEPGVPAEPEEPAAPAEVDDGMRGPAWAWALAGAAVLTAVWWVLVRRRLARDPQ